MLAGMKSNDAMALLGLRLPVVQGPFGGGLSTVELAGAVADRGGLGSFGAHVTAPSEIQALADSLRARTRGPFALNLWMSDHDAGGVGFSEAEFDRHYAVVEPYFRELGLEKPAFPESVTHRCEDQVEALVAATPPAFSFVFGIPSPAVMEKCRLSDIKTIGTATTLAEAQALDAAGVDAIVATGMEAGGHRPSFLASPEDSLTGTFALVQILRGRVKAPVIAAGGVADAAGIRTTMQLGAQAAQLGTAFLACAESGTTDAHRAQLFADPAPTTVLTRAFTGRLSRGIGNRITRELAGQPLAPFPLQGWLMAHLKRATAGRTDLAATWSGQVASLLKHRTAPALMEALAADLA